jgi:hypothetical protein
LAETSLGSARFHALFFLASDFRAAGERSCTAPSFAEKAVRPFEARSRRRNTQTAGTGTLMTIVAWMVSGGFYVVRGTVPLFGIASGGGDVTPWPIMVAANLSLAWTTATLSGVHRVRWWWALLALASIPVALTLMAIVAALVTTLHR